MGLNFYLGGGGGYLLAANDMCTTCQVNVQIQKCLRRGIHPRGFFSVGGHEESIFNLPVFTRM